MKTLLDNIFRLSENKTTIRTELLAGLTTFMTMAYILAVNPEILSVGGASKEGLFTATAVASCLGCLLMGIIANMPVGLAPSLGLSSFFAFTVIVSMGHSFAFALVAVFLSGVMFLLMSVFGIRELIYNSIPKIIKNSITVGIGLFIAVIGLKGSGIIVANPSTFVALGDLTDNAVILGLGGIILTVLLLEWKVPAAIFVSIIITTIIGIPMGVTQISSDFVPYTTNIQFENYYTGFDWSLLWTFDMFIVVAIFTIVAVFDVIGTLIGVCNGTSLMKENGEIKNIKRAFIADAIATTVGAVFGTSSVGSYVESSAGILLGGRTGLTAIVVGFMFLLSLLFAPLFLLIPASAICSALFMVGVYMIRNILQIDFKNLNNAVPAYVTIIFTPFSYSIANGIMLGIISYVLINVFTRKFSNINVTLIVLFVVFCLKFILGY